MKKNCFQLNECELIAEIGVLPGFLNRLVAVSAPAGAEAAIAAASSAAAAGISPCSTAITAASTIAATATAAVLLRPSAAVGGASASQLDGRHRLL